MAASRYRFGDFLLDVDNRLLQRNGTPVPLNARYFDALVLLLREQGRLVGKQRFFDEVWAHSVVTDAALTQCIKALRRALGDDAAAPRFVRTVAGHGYAFIAPVETLDGDLPSNTPSSASAGTALPAVDPSPSEPVPPPADRESLGIAAAPAINHRSHGWPQASIAATLGGAGAGLLGGVLYGSMLSLAPAAQGLGRLSVLLVLLALSVVVGALGGFGVGLGLAVGRRLRPDHVGVPVGAALGGMLIGALVKLLGSDAFTLLVGRAPDGITGGLEGAAIGLAIGVAWLLAQRRPQQAWIAGAVLTGLTGALLPLAGGSLMATSLARVAAAFDDSRLDMAPLGGLFGEPQFGLLVQTTLGAVEGAVFGGCVVGALLLARRGRASGA